MMDVERNDGGSVRQGGADRFDGDTLIGRDTLHRGGDNALTGGFKLSHRSSLSFAAGMEMNRQPAPPSKSKGLIQFPPPA